MAGARVRKRERNNECRIERKICKREEYTLDKGERAREVLIHIMCICMPMTSLTLPAINSHGLGQV